MPSDDDLERGRSSVVKRVLLAGAVLAGVFGLAVIWRSHAPALQQVEIIDPDPQRPLSFDVKGIELLSDGDEPRGWRQFAPSQSQQVIVRLSSEAFDTHSAFGVLAANEADGDQIETLYRIAVDEPVDTKYGNAWEKRNLGGRAVRSLDGVMSLWTFEHPFGTCTRDPVRQFVPNRAAFEVLALPIPPQPIGTGARWRTREIIDFDEPWGKVEEIIEYELLTRSSRAIRIQAKIEYRNVEGRTHPTCLCCYDYVGTGELVLAGRDAMPTGTITFDTHVNDTDSEDTIRPDRVLLEIRAP